MEKLIEEACVRETEHLVPNLGHLSRMLFGTHSYFLDWQKSHIDWATAKCKHPDGLVWCPWSKQLWIVEAEWTQESNFFGQCRAFASGRIDRNTLRKELLDCLSEIKDVIASAAHHMKEDLLFNNIVEKTLEQHVHGNELRPHAWVILGHDATNFDHLRQKYERELQAWFKDDQRYVLSMVRMFRGPCSTILMLEQHGPCIGTIEKAILVPALSRTVDVESTLNSPSRPGTSPRAGNGIESVPMISKALFKASDTSQPWSSRRKRRIEIQILSRRELWEDFIVRRRLTVHEFKKLSEFRPGALAGFVKLLTGNGIATRHGDLFTLVDSAAERVRDILHGSGKKDEGHVSHPAPDRENIWPERRRYRIEAKILERAHLWKTFLEKRQMSVNEFKQAAKFDSRTIGGFFHFLTKNRFFRDFRGIFHWSQTGSPE